MENKLLDIILIKSSFERIPVIAFEETLKLSNTLNVSHSLTEENDLIVKFFYEMKAVNEEESQFNLSCEHIVQFELNDYVDNEENNEQLERFSNVNAAAIIYPFIRELVYSITSKAGMLAIVIPSMNFIKEYEKKKAEKNYKA